MYKENRLAKKEDFNKVYRTGKSFANQQFVLYYLFKKDQTDFRLGVSVSKKLGNAVVRNRLRRMMKEIIRAHHSVIPKELDFILIARLPCVNLSYQEMESSILHVLKRSSVIKRGNSSKPK